MRHTLRLVITNQAAHALRTSKGAAKLKNYIFLGPLVTMEKNRSAAIPKLECGYSTISPDELMTKVIPDYCIDNPIECRFWERGANDTYQVRCSDTCYFLRIYRHNAYPLEANEFEAEFLNYLHKKGFPVAYPIPRKSGGFIKEIRASEGSRFVLVTALAEGENPDYNSLENCRLVGKSVAQMHQISDGFTTSSMRNPLDLNWLLEYSLSVIRNNIKHLPEKLSLIEKAAQDIRAAVTVIPEEQLDIGVCHGDLHGGNLHLSKGEIIHFDFEECALGYRLYDLATFKWGICGESNGAERWTAFIEGYQSIRPISEQSLSLIDPFVIVREIAETAYGIRHIRYFGYNDIMATDIDHVCDQLKKYSKN